MSRPVEMLTRAAQAADIPAITDIYAWHVLYGCASFKETPPDAAEMHAASGGRGDRCWRWLVTASKTSARSGCI